MLPQSLGRKPGGDAIHSVRFWTILTRSPKSLGRKPGGDAIHSVRFWTILTRSPKRCQARIKCAPHKKPPLSRAPCAPHRIAAENFFRTQSARPRWR